MKNEWIKVPVETLQAGDVVELGRLFGRVTVTEDAEPYTKDGMVQVTVDRGKPLYRPPGFLMKVQTVPVIFRRWPKREGGEVIAIFPTLVETQYPNRPPACLAYQHTGQHGGCDVFIVDRTTLVRDPAEYADLKRELESAPYFYKLRVVQKWPRVDYRNS